MPRLPPVTSATFPASGVFILISLPFVSLILAIRILLSRATFSMRNSSYSQGTRVAKVFPQAFAALGHLKARKMGLPGVSSESHESGHDTCYNLLHRYGLRCRAPFPYNPKVLTTDELSNARRIVALNGLFLWRNGV
jgi:hypothetical protein